MNRLAQETSPYLRQHACNPVDWYPWGGEALEKARLEDKPIFLSIGYSACHWCHVMERESFENTAVAALLNEHFVSIKVDREERPDLDGIYMAAVMALTGGGGWPMSVFLTPDLKPFYAGTYFPPDNRYGRPGFITILYGVLLAWKERRQEVEDTATDLGGHVAAQLAGTPTESESLAPELLAHAAEAVSRAFDARFGGWSGAPKFPSSGAIMLLLREHRRTGHPELLQQVTQTLDAMAAGGLYDHLGGGFHRYSVDEQWRVPHFEKMLYDNAQLAQAYLEAWQVTRNPRYQKIARKTLDYVLRDMRDPSGGFYSSEDADSEGQEGKFYLWTKDEITRCLGEPDAVVFCACYGVQESGNFPSHEPYHSGRNILQATHRPEFVALEFGISLEALEAKLQACRETLRVKREQRVRPGRDDKVITAWNALMISALAQAAQVLGESRYREAAVEAGRFIIHHMFRDGLLLRTYCQGQSRLPGYLDDYASTVNAFIDLYETSFDPAWIDRAQVLTETMLQQFWEAEGRTFFYTSEEHRHLLVRTRPFHDGAEPSGGSMAALALLRLGTLLNRGDYLEKARRLLETHAGWMRRAPQACLRMLCAVDCILSPPAEIVVAGNADDPRTQAFLACIRERFLPAKMVALTDENRPAHDLLPMLEGKTPLHRAPAVYVCQQYTCHPPVHSVEALAALLDGCYAVHAA